jgi:surfeit locus 1 family protein
VRQNLELAAFGAETGLTLRPATVVEDANADNAADGLRRDWPSGNGGVGVTTNYGYAVQWFAMSIAFLGLWVWLQFIRPRRLATSGPDSEFPVDARVDERRPR